ncbi:hypothetical protein [Terriglobus albidus]|uniref:hypothetical protein n=1 Tax=Terriglobus albidus TaxID=1592106 RepID=UPI0021DFB6CF|nr:hypothetical protein [Terriglobus albidus]
MTSSLAQSSAHMSPPSREQVDAALDELARILTSDSFSSSKRCRDFLEFVVKRALAGDAENLTERFLGVELFGRAVDYETATDSIVRVRANDVRRRLAQYYSSQRSVTPVRIDLMAGGYIPEFHWKLQEAPSQPATQELPSPVDHPPVSTVQEDQSPLAPKELAGQHTKAPGRARLFWWSGAAAFIAVAVWTALALRPHTTNFDRFWQPILDAPASPVVSLPTSDTIQLQSNAMQQFSRLKPGESLSLGLADVQAFHNWHISLPVLQATLSVTLALERKGKTPLVRQGTDLKMDELRGHPIIAIGSFSNPWTQQNVAGLRFTFDRGDSDSGPPRIRDAFNPQRLWSLLRTYPEPQAKDYAIVTRTFDPVTHEPFLSLAGLHSFGNQIAGEFVSQESSWNEVAARAPAGWEKKNLQVVLETNLVGTTTSSPKIVDVYFW